MKLRKPPMQMRKHLRRLIQTSYLFGPACGLLVMVFLSACASSTPTPLPPTPLPPTPLPTAIPVDGTIVAVGDSLTEGFGVDLRKSYPAQLERKLQANGYNYTVINAGVSGETSSGTRARVDWILTLDPDIIILAIGGNDSLRALDPSLTEENLTELVTAFQDAGVTVILAGMQTVQNMGQEYTDAFRAIYPAVAEAHGLILIPFLLEGVAGDPTLNQDDFIHPTAEGYAIVVETVYPYVVEAIGRD